MNSLRPLTVLPILAALAGAARADNEIGFVESFALATDRDSALRQLVPGTEPFYYYHGLHLQNQGRRADLMALFEEWAKRTPDSALRRQLETRQALLDYSTDPKRSLDFIAHRLSLNFDHQRERPSEKPDLPTSLDPKLVSPDEFLRRALEGVDHLNNLTEYGVELLVRSGRKLTPSQIRHALQRVQRPDVPGLVALIAADLASTESRGFGEFAVHRNLLRAQLDEVRQLRPDLVANEAFVHTYLAKLAPGADEDIAHDPAARQAWLDRAGAFVSTLGPTFNSLKAHLLYQRLDHDRRQGIYDAKRFLEYARLPRVMPYISPRWQKDERTWRHPADLAADFSAVTHRPPIGSDVELVRDYLLRLLIEAPSPEAYAAWFETAWLKAVFAEAKLTAGVGKATDLASFLTPEAFEALKNRVDLDFDPANAIRFEPDGEVTLDLWVKNVPKLIVKIFELNTPACYQARPEPVSTDIDLDGLVAGHELAVDYDEAPLRRVRRNFRFPEIKAGRGVWVIEFIGNGQASRALVRKGALRFLTHPGSAGTVISVLDEKNQPLPAGYLTLNGRRFDADKNGDIVVPFSAEPGVRPVILHDGKGFASLERINLEGEAYALDAGFHVERESLLMGGKSRVAIRTRLTLNGAAVSAALLDKVALTITSTDLDGLPTTQTISPFKLSDDREAIREFTVPDRLASVRFDLTGKVKSLSQGREIDLQTNWTFAINEIDRTEHVGDLFFGHAAGAYFLEQRGKNGERHSERAVSLNLWHRDYTVPVSVALKTNAEGRIELGSLDGVARLEATTAGGLARSWAVHQSKIQATSQIQAAAGAPILVPVVAAGPISLLEVRQGTFVRDWTPNVEIKDGLAHLKDLPAGDYALHLLGEGRALTVRVAQGAPVRQFVISPARLLELTPKAPLAVPPITLENEEVIIRILNADPLTRVHVAGVRYQPAFSLYDQLGLFPAPALRAGRPGRADSQFVSGRDIGDELRYILDRKGAAQFSGVMLERPGLLLNPWSVRDTSTTTQEARSGETFEKLAAAPTQQMVQAEIDAAKAAAPGRLSSDPRTLDFLAEAAPITYNGGAGDEGMVRIKLADLGKSTQLHVLVLNAHSAIYRQLALPAKSIDSRDLRLAGGLDPKAHFAQRDEIALVESDKPFVIDDALATRFEVYGDLGRAFALLRTLSNNQTLEEFRFILDWPTYDEKKKRELYSKFACHELSFFLARKDPEFFSRVIQPYLRNKKDRTFLDDYLLGVDLKGFVEPWNHGRLNAVERILLGRRLADERENEVRALADLVATLPVDREDDRRRLEVALRGFVLGGTTELTALEGAKRELEQLGDLELKDRVESLARRSLATTAGATPAAPAPADAAGKPDSPNAGRSGRNRMALQRGAQSKLMDEKKLAFGAVPLDDSLLVAQESAATAEDALGLVTANFDAREKSAGVAFFRKLETTKEWAENNYWHLIITDQNAGLVPASRFWLDYARHAEGKPFVSPHLATATRHFTEMMLALSVLDLPFPSQAAEPGVALEAKKLTLTPKTPLLVFQQAVRPAKVIEAGPKLLVSQNFYRRDDRYTEKDGEKLDKFVTGEFLTGVVYGCQVVVTNPTSSNQKLDCLFQIPEGALPAMGARATNHRALGLEPFHTQTFEVAFYFPRPGTFQHFPVHVSRTGDVVAFAEPVSFNVVDALSKPDTTSWAWVSQNAPEADVLAFLDRENLVTLDLDRIAWRLARNADFFRQVIDRLVKRRIYHALTFSFGVRHNHTAAVREFLKHEGSLLEQAGPWLQSALVTIDPIERRSFEHLEYKPLVNARAHRLGADRTILNDRFRAQYQRLLAILAAKPALDDIDSLAVAGYLLLQDRTEEASAFFQKVKRENVPVALQYDYTQAWLALARDDTAAARDLALRHAEHPVDKWREKFAQLSAQLDEIEGKGPQVTSSDDRDQTQDRIAASQPSFELKVEGRTLRLDARNLTEATVNYYLMDLEFLFSTNPFVGQNSARFAQIKPNQSEAVKIEGPASSRDLPLPREFQNRNVLVEVVAAGQRKSQAVYANDLKVAVSEDYGQIQVRHAADDRPVPKVYVKVYAESRGRAKFFKDGYTDLRGKFDYATLSTNEIDQVGRFSILVMSDKHGAMVREAKPPQR